MKGWSVIPGATSNFAELEKYLATLDVLGEYEHANVAASVA